MTSEALALPSHQQDSNAQDLKAFPSLNSNATHLPRGTWGPHSQFDCQCCRRTLAPKQVKRAMIAMPSIHLRPGQFCGHCQDVRKWEVSQEGLTTSLHAASTKRSPTSSRFPTLAHQFAKLNHALVRRRVCTSRKSRTTYENTGRKQCSEETTQFKIVVQRVAF